MNTKNIILAAAISLALVGNAQAAEEKRGFKAWLKDKKEQIQEHTAPPAQAQQAPTPATDLPGVEVQGQQPGKPPVDHGKALDTAGKGCAIGGLLGGLLGVDPQIGCVVGGGIGYGFSYRKQINEAREVEAAARAAGMDATVSTEQRVDEKGKKREALAALTIRYEPADMEAMGPKTVAMLDRLAGMAEKSKAQLTIRFEGTQACQIPLMELHNRQVLERHTVVNECGKSTQNQIVVSPLPVPAR